MNLTEFNQLVNLEYPEWNKSYSPTVVEKGLVKANAVLGDKVVGIFNQTKKTELWFIKKKDGTHRKGVINKGQVKKGEVSKNSNFASIYITEEEFKNNIIV